MQERVPAGTELHELDETFEALLVERAQKVVAGANPRRCRQLIGMLTEFRDKGGSTKMQLYYRRAVQEAILDALEER